MRSRVAPLWLRACRRGDDLPARSRGSRRRRRRRRRPSRRDDGEVVEQDGVVDPAARLSSLPVRECTGRARTRAGRNRPGCRRDAPVDDESGQAARLGGAGHDLAPIAEAVAAADVTTGRRRAGDVDGAVQPEVVARGECTVTAGPQTRNDGATGLIAAGTRRCVPRLVQGRGKRAASTTAASGRSISVRIVGPLGIGCFALIERPGESEAGGSGASRERRGGSVQLEPIRGSRPRRFGSPPPKREPCPPAPEE